PVRLSIHIGWNAPAASAAKAPLCPGEKLKLLRLAASDTTLPPLRAESAPPPPPPRPPRPPPPPAPPRPLVNHVSFPPHAVACSVTFTLGVHVSPPSSEQRIRTFHPRSSLNSRRSYHCTQATPSLFTATVGVRLSGPYSAAFGPGRSSLTTMPLDQVRPLSLEYDIMISRRPLRKSLHATYKRSLNRVEPGSTARCGMTAPSERGRFI